MPRPSRLNGLLYGGLKVPHYDHKLAENIEYAGLGIVLNQHLLPSNFPAHRRVNAWTAGKTLGAQLLTFRFPRSEEGFARPT